jgi:hypothetical protein
MPIQGVSNAKAEVKHSVNLCSLQASNGTVALECLVLPKISGDLPDSYINTIEWNLPKDLHLADPGFNQPGRLDLLIGTEAFFHLVKAGRKTSWIISCYARHGIRVDPSRVIPTCSAYKCSSIDAENVLFQKRYQPRVAVATVLGNGRAESTSTI